MSWDVGMPNLGHTMEEGKVTEWLKEVGHPVAAGEVIATVETEKATFDVEAPADGILLAINVPAGTVVPVGTIIGAIGQPGEAVRTAPEASPARPRRVNATPAARSLAAELGIDLADITGTGDGGSITRDDVRAHALSAGPADADAQPSAMRRAIAQATEQAWRTIPHVALFRRAPLADAAGSANITARVVRSSALALRRHPHFNGWWVDARFRRAASVDVAVAMSAADGLLMPAVRAAEAKTAEMIGADIAALAAAARSGTLDGAQTVDASFTVSSLGRWGVDAFAPIINAPQVAILGVGAIEHVAREAPDGSVRFRSELSLCLVFDHRANDGVAAAEFLADIVSNLGEHSA